MKRGMDKGFAITDGSTEVYHVKAKAQSSWMGNLIRMKCNHYALPHEMRSTRPRDLKMCKNCRRIKK